MALISDREGKNEAQIFFMVHFPTSDFLSLQYLGSSVSPRKKQGNHKHGPLIKPELSNLSTLLLSMHKMSPYYTDHSVGRILFLKST